ncbi:hypothetical protein Ahy_B10g105731 isoform C [Arachis hypogaea]|uniref:Uncharacterized protein n=1 Tax=Arachis hypogaea TaxID=3818 RepID=A0A444X8P7_ARAHY|nr:hypothetical protein Ahy_B10g105731 isoform C [Arachis hypogaea]
MGSSYADVITLILAWLGLVHKLAHHIRQNLPNAGSTTKHVITLFSLLNRTILLIITIRHPNPNRTVTLLRTLLKLQRKLQHPNDVVHGRPQRSIIQQTTNSNLTELPQTLGSNRAFQSGVHNLTQRPVVPAVSRPINKRYLFLLSRTDQRRPCA